MKKILSIVLALVLVLGLSLTAMASVAFDSATGTGFVGKGDVQTVFVWNNSTIQKNMNGISFTYNSKDTYKVTEYWEKATGQGEIKTFELEVPKHVSVNASVALDLRVKNQLNGFNLTGFGAITYDGTVPAVGDPLTGNRQVFDDATGTWITATVTDVQLEKSEGGLFVNYNGVSVAMPNTPVVTTTVP
jgi:hypothetical protein